jgi:Ca2+-binding RTX toxin-like protein
VTFTFSEAPTGFDVTDVTVSNGAISGLTATGDPLVFTATFTPSADGPASVGVTAASYTDAAGNEGAGGDVALTVAASPPPPPPAPPTASEGDDVVSFAGAAGDFAAGAGDDQVSGWALADWLQGNTGQDTITGADGSDTVLGGKDDDLVHGNAGADLVFGGNGADVVRGGRDGDLVQGNAGADFVFGDRGDDIVRGGQGDDHVYGGEGADRLFGDLGDDVLTGGAGADLFVFDAAGQDTVTDFSEADGDVVHISRALAGDFEALSGHISADSQGNAVIAFDGQSLTLAGISPGALSAEYFLFG